MKFRLNDQVLVTGGKDKGKRGKITRVFPKLERVIVEGANLYVKHLKPMSGREGQRIVRERALPTAKIAIINDKGQPDRIGYKVAKDGSKERIFKKTGKSISAAAPAKSEKSTLKK
jgi:large subunit ribosomal protein L24